MKDYLGNEINIGDTVLFNEKACKGYYTSFTEAKVVEMYNGIKKKTVKLDFQDYIKEVNNVIDLTALGLREKDWCLWLSFYLCVNVDSKKCFRNMSKAVQTKGIGLYDARTAMHM